jgi:hypothetical protein
MALRRTAEPPPPETARPTLDLSGPALSSSPEILVTGSEEAGGIEAYVEGIKLKSRRGSRRRGSRRFATR